MNEPAAAIADVSPYDDPRMRRLELWISTVLRIGVIISTTLIVVGTITIFVQHPKFLSSKDELKKLVGPEAAFPHALVVLVSGVRELHGEAIVTLGLLVLMATPLARVVVSVIFFIRKRDRVYALLTAAVLLLLLLSLVLGKVE